MNSPLGPSAFFDRYADHFGAIPQLKEQLDALMAGTSDGDSQPFPPAYDLETPPDHPSDPVESVSGKSTAVVAFFPITDWLNYGESGKTVRNGQ